ncbi:MAG: hypothetical protein ACOC4Y_01265 [bacterium]
MLLKLVRGLPGSGKSDYIKSKFECMVVEDDFFHIHNGIYDFSPSVQRTALQSYMPAMVEYVLMSGSDVVVCGVFHRKEDVDRYKNIAEEFNVPFQVICMCNDFGSIHNIDPYDLEDMKADWEDYPGEIYVNQSIGA